MVKSHRNVAGVVMMTTFCPTGVPGVGQTTVVIQEEQNYGLLPSCRTRSVPHTQSCSVADAVILTTYYSVGLWFLVHDSD